MSNIIKKKFGTHYNASSVARGSCSSVQKKGSFYCFSLRLSQHDIREYSFTDFERALNMRKHMIEHVEKKILLDVKKAYYNY